MKYKALPLIFLILFSICLSCRLVSKPYWIKGGVYIEYRIGWGKKKGMPPAIAINADVRYVGEVRELKLYKCYHFSNATYRIVFLNISGRYAFFKAYFTCWNISFTWERIGIINVSGLFKVDLDNRSVYTADGEYIGITPLWIPVANITPGKTKVALPLINGSIRYMTPVAWGGRPIATFYRNFTRVIVFPLISLYYDRDTGVLLRAYTTFIDPVISYLLNCSFLASTNVILYERNIVFEEKHQTYPNIAWILLPLSLILFIIYCLIILIKRKHK